MRSWRTLVILGVIAVLGALLFGALGMWQLQRLHWKNDLVAAIAARTTAAPVDPSLDGTWDSFEPEQDEYRRVMVSGRFEHGAETLVQAVTAYGGGFWVVTPLVLDDGRSVLVNRGFVPPEQREPATRPAPEGDVTITGLLRQSEPGGGFLRSNDPAGGAVVFAGCGGDCGGQGVGNAAPFFIDAEAGAAGSYPIGGLTVLSFSNNHLVYALTWFALALMLVGGFGYLLWDRRRVG